MSEKLTYTVSCHMFKFANTLWQTIADDDFLPFHHREACLYKLTCEWNKKSQSKIRQMVIQTPREYFKSRAHLAISSRMS